MATAAYRADWSLGPSVSRRCSTETVYSIQDIETDVVRDTSDTEPDPTDSEIEYEPVTEPEHDAPIDGSTSDSTDKDIIKTEIISVKVRDDGDLQLADSEFTDTGEVGFEFKRQVFLKCAQCMGNNTNPTYRYCNKCFTMRKNFFPPRPRRYRNKSKAKSLTESTKLTEATSSGCSQEICSQTSGIGSIASEHDFDFGRLKRRGGSLDRGECKKSRHNDSGTETDMDEPVQPLVKSVSDLYPSQIEPPIKLTKKNISNKILEKMDAKDLCVVCVTEPKSGIFVHGRIAHICCCYRCAVKVWSSARRCPICNRKVSNVLRAVVM